MMRKSCRVHRLAVIVALAMLVAACTETGGSDETTMVVEQDDTTTVAGSEATTTTATAEAGEAAELRFTLWIPPDAVQMEAFTAIKDEYESANPNVSISYDFIPFNDYESVVTLQLSGNDPPDAGWLVERSAPTFTQAGVLADIQQKLVDDASYNYDDFAKGATELWVDGEAVYGVPFSTSPFMILYNKSLLEEAGAPLPDDLIESGEWTWSSVAEIARTVKEATGVYGFQSNDAGLYIGNFWITIEPIQRAFGARPWDENNACGWDSEGSQEALTLLHDMIFVDESAVPPGTEVDFFAGDAALTIGQLSRVGTLAEAAFEWDVAPLPAGPAGAPAVIGQAAITVFANGDSVEQASDFVRFMTSEENVARLSAFFPPARESVLGSDEFYSANPLLSAERIENVVANSILEGSVLSSHPQFATIELTVRTLLDGLWVEDGDVAATTSAICDAIQPILGG